MDDKQQSCLRLIKMKLTIKRERLNGQLKFRKIIVSFDSMLEKIYVRKSVGVFFISCTSETQSLPYFI